VCQVWTENVEKFQEELELRAPPDTKRCQERKRLLQENNGTLKYPEAPDLKCMMKYLLELTNDFEQYQVIQILAHDQNPTGSNKWMARTINLLAQRCCMQMSTSTQAETRHGRRGGSGKKREPEYEKWGMLLFDAKKVPGWNHEQHPAHWLGPLLASLFYLIMGESKTVIAFDADIINTSLISWRKTYDILMKPLRNHKTADGEIAVQTITEPEGPCNSGIVIMEPANKKQQEKSVFKEVRKSLQKGKCLEEAMSQWAATSIEGAPSKTPGKESDPYCDLDQIRREHDKNLWNNLPLAREEAENTGELVTRWIIAAVLFSAHCHPLGARTLRKSYPMCPKNISTIFPEPMDGQV
jgi:hypothetical protein